MTVYKMEAHKDASENILRMLDRYWGVLNTHKSTLEDSARSVYTSDDGTARDLLILQLKRELNSDKSQLQSFKNTYGGWFAVKYGGLYYQQLIGLIDSLNNIITHINSLISTNYWDSTAGKPNVSIVSQADRDQLGSDIGDELSANQVATIPIQSVAADVAIELTGDYMKVRGNSGAVEITATPSIDLAPIEGHHITLQGASDTNTLTIQDESSLSGSKVNLNGGSDITLGFGDILTLVYNRNTGAYYEVSRSNV